MRRRPPGADRTAPRRRGFSLIELAIALAILSVLAAAALPDFGRVLSGHRLRSVAEHLQADIARARLAALQSGRDGHIRFRTGPAGCHALSLDAPVDCAEPQHRAEVLRIDRAAEHPGVWIEAAEPIVIDGRHGLPRPLAQGGHVRIVNREGEAILLRIGPSGRATLCAWQRPLARLPVCEAPRGDRSATSGPATGI